MRAIGNVRVSSEEWTMLDSDGMPTVRVGYWLAISPVECRTFDYSTSEAMRADGVYASKAEAEKLAIAWAEIHAADVRVSAPITVARGPWQSRCL